MEIIRYPRAGQPASASISQHIRIALGGALALTLSGLSVACCYIFGTHLAPGDEGLIYGVLGAVADALKALLPIAIGAALVAGQNSRAAIGIILFAVFSLYSFASELGLYALSRDAQASGTTADKASFSQWQDERARVRDRLKALPAARPSRTITADLTGQRQNAIWASSGECREATLPASRTFCAGLAKLEAEFAAAQEAEQLQSKEDALTAKIDGLNLADVMRAADPQSEALSRLTGWPASRIRDGLAVLIALLIELGSGFGLFAVTASGAPKAAPGRFEKAQEDHPVIRPTPEIVLPGGRKSSCLAPDPVRAFAKAAIVRKPGKEIAASDLHAAYARWAAGEGAKPLSPGAFGRRLTAMQFQRIKRGGAVLYSGIDIVPGSRTN